MKVNAQHIHEKSPGADYEYDLYEFEAPGLKYVARSYVSEPHEAHFLRKEVGGQTASLKTRDIQSALFRDAVAYLRGLGKVKVSYLSSEASSYVVLDPEPAA